MVNRTMKGWGDGSPRELSLDENRDHKTSNVFFFKNQTVNCKTRLRTIFATVTSVSFFRKPYRTGYVVFIKLAGFGTL
jgi:hypothetical protein